MLKENNNYWTRPLLPIPAFLSCLKRFKGLAALTVILSIIIMIIPFKVTMNNYYYFYPKNQVCCRNSLKLNPIKVDLIGEFSGRKNVACLLT